MRNVIVNSSTTGLTQPWLHSGTAGLPPESEDWPELSRTGEWATGIIGTHWAGWLPQFFPHFVTEH